MPALRPCLAALAAFFALCAIARAEDESRPYGDASDAERAELRGEAEIAGRLAWSGGAPAARQKFDVVAIRPGANPAKIGEAETDADGNYRVAGLAAGKARFRLFLAADPSQRTFPIFVAKDGAHVRYDYAFQPRVGDPAPPHVMPGLDGKPVDLAAFKGKVVIVKFWAVWCGPCHAQMDDLAATLRAHPEWKGEVAVLAVNLDAERKTAEDFIRQHRLEGMIQMHEPGKKIEAARGRGFHVDAIPFEFVLDRKGIVRARGDRDAGLAELVERLIKEEPAP